MWRPPGEATSSPVLAVNSARTASTNIWKRNRSTLISTNLPSGGTEMASIQLRTPIPGPRSKELMQRRNAAVAQGPFHVTPIFIERAEGAMIEDVDGNRMLDFAGGIGCLNTGHRPAAVLDAIRKQLDRFLHTSFNVLPYESYVRLAERLNALAPGPGPKKTVLVSTGAEAVENAIKIARTYTKRTAIIAF